MAESLTDQLTLLAQQHAQVAARLAAWDARLERQQFLNDAAQSRHSDALDRHTERMTALQAMLERQQQLQADLTAQMAALAQRQEAHLERLDRHAERLAWYEDLVTRLDAARAGHQQRLDRLDTILQAIRDLLDRPNGH